MRNGFSAKLSESRRRPRFQIKHLNNRAAMKRMTVPRGRHPERRRRNLSEVLQPFWGTIIDVRTLASAVTSESHSLKSLAKSLHTETEKIGDVEHGARLTNRYLDYARTDVQVTWECYDSLRRTYEAFGLATTPVNQILSEAGIGKGFLHEMNIIPWRRVQPAFSTQTLSAILSSYFGGRSEVHIRHEITRVAYCDFRFAV